MLSDTQISRLLDVANAACHGGNVVDARAMYAGVLALRPGFAPALMGKALSHIVVDDFDEAERLLKEEVLAALPEDEYDKVGEDVWIAGAAWSVLHLGEAARRSRSCACPAGRRRRPESGAGRRVA